MRSATGSNLIPLGLINCSFEFGQVKFNGDFIVCKSLTRPLILGRDFLIHVKVQNMKCNKMCGWYIILHQFLDNSGSPSIVEQ